jgi:hypothetical protein
MNQATKTRERAAGVDTGFTDYRAQAQRAFPKISDRDLGNAWMRGQAWAASGAKSMVVRERGGAPEPSAADVCVSARYGDTELQVFVNPEELRDCIAAWERVLNKESVPKAERQTVSEQYVLAHLVHQDQGDGRKTGVAMAALAWLIAGSPIGDAITKPDSLYRRFHCEITDPPDDDGGRPEFHFVCGLTANATSSES